jgi:putative DNA primase/helicase
MEVNSRPRISGDDDGIWGRIVIILFPRQFRRKPGWQKKQKAMLLANQSGVLRWIVEGALGYLHEGLTPPAEVAAAIEEYRRSANPFSEWMAERVDLTDPNVLTLATELFNDYKDWCARESVGDREIMSSTAFGRAMGDRQILRGPKNRAGLIQRRGARLRHKDELSFEEADIAEDAAELEEGGDDRPW